MRDLIAETIRGFVYFQCAAGSDELHRVPFPQFLNGQWRPCDQCRQVTEDAWFKLRYEQLLAEGAEHFNAQRRVFGLIRDLKVEAEKAGCDWRAWRKRGDPT